MNTYWVEASHHYIQRGTYSARLRYTSFGIPYSISWTVYSTSSYVPQDPRMWLQLHYNSSQLWLSYSPVPDGSGSFPPGTPVTVIAHPRPGWRITNWSLVVDLVDYRGRWDAPENEVCPLYSTSCVIPTPNYGPYVYHTQDYYIDAEPTTYISIFTPEDPTNEDQVTFYLGFADPGVSGLSAQNFELVPGGALSGARITSVTGSGTAWQVTATTGTGSGTLGLRAINQDGVNIEVVDLPYESQPYTIDKTPPVVQITASPPHFSNNSATIAFSSNEANSTFLCGLHGAVSPCISPVQFDNLADGSYLFLVRATDAAGNFSQSVGAYWTVDAISAEKDDYTTDEDTPLTVVAPGLLANDFDAGGEPLTAALVSGPSHGALTLNTSGSFTYTPAADYSGDDSFTYRASDGRASSIATVSIKVYPVEDAPMAANDSYSTNRGTPLTAAAPGVLSNDRDADGDMLTAKLESTTSHGKLVLAADGSFSYQPSAGYTGPDSFSYLATDGKAKGTLAVVALRVGHVVAANDNYRTDEGVSLTIAAPGVLPNDRDLTGVGNPLTAVLVSGPSHGQLVLAADGSFSYIPDATFNGRDSFTYAASDGSVTSAPAQVTITVQTAKGPLAVDNSYVTAAGAPLLVKVSDLLANDLLGGQGLMALLDSGPANGVLVLKKQGVFEYMPNAGFSGVDRFTYVITDGTNVSNIATVTITVE